ncbi:MAG TPA: hypothetical protein VFI11_03855 [Anaerolineales bacterium]|nr:hypothetical protein [Anaerolineales bacterium]
MDRIPRFLPLLLASVLLAACVSRGQFDQVSTDLAAAQQRADSLQAELDALKAEAATLREDLASSEEQVAGYEDKIAQAAARARVIESIFLPAIRGEIYAMSQAEAASLFLEWGRLVDETGDQRLKDSFQAILDTGFATDSVVDFLTNCIDGLMQSLEGEA